MKTATAPRLSLLCASVLALPLMLAGCDDDDKKSESSGRLVDSAVEGVGYSTPSFEGYTDADGVFRFRRGEAVSFFIGDIEFPSVRASRLLTPLDIAGVDDINNNVVVNIIRLLQSLDSDNNPDNGINIDESSLTTGALDFSLSESDFEAQVFNVMGVTLISIADAIAHFQKTLSELEQENSGGGDVSTLPDALKSTSMVMQFTYEAPGAPYALNDRVSFIFSGSGNLFLDLTPDDNNGDALQLTRFEQVNSEYVWYDDENGYSYAVSLMDDEVHEINVSSIDPVAFLGQFEPYMEASSFDISGTISGYAGGNSAQWELWLDDSIANDGALANGAVTYNSDPVADGSSYEVTVTAPAGQSCEVSNGSGTVSGAHVINVDIQCSDNAFNLGGTTSGLPAGSGFGSWELFVDGSLVTDGGLQNGFTNYNSNPVADGASYEVIVHPTSAVDCTVSNASGSLSGSDIDNIDISCSEVVAGYDIGGTTSGLPNSNNFGQWELFIDGKWVNDGGIKNGYYNYNYNPVADGASYEVKLSPSSSVTCSISNGSGTVNGTTIDNVDISCQ